ncbi:HLA class I histocompatibility antigen alpha chain family protein, partial [Enterobacter hormaechei]|uniref:HLA class I histocompatibility antigen alpha chain family protein n=2 Tax=Enterobacter hormaechei TaxID=158836 RepID=UPI0011EC3967
RTDFQAQFYRTNIQSITNMRSVVLLLLGVHLVNSGMHSHIVIYTATKGLPDFPEFVAATMVDGTQVNYYDSEIKEVIPRQDWVRGAVDEQFWQRNTQIRSSMHQTFKNNINIAMERFNQTQGVHTYQEMYGCEWDDETEEITGFDEDGFDGEDFTAMDYKENRYISPVSQGLASVEKWNREGTLQRYKQYLSTICVEWLKKYLEYGKSSLQKKVSPQVSLLQKDPSSPVMCHATG